MFRAFIFVAFVLLSVPSQARVHRNWTYKELVAESDAVVIAVASPPRKIGKIRNDPDSEFYERIHTTLNIHVVLKGNVDTKTIEFVHSRLKPGNFDLSNGRRLIYFQTEGRAWRYRFEVGEGYKPKETPQYLLFLKRTSDGHYEAVSGQDDPVDSIMLLEPSHKFPDPSRFKERVPDG